MIDEKKISQNDDPTKGPLDGIQLKTECVRTKFTKRKQKNGFAFKQRMTEVNVSASVETGTFSIRDTKTDIMLAIRIEDAMRVCAAAVEANMKAEKEQGDA